MTIAATTPATERTARWQRYLADIENYATVPQPLEMQGTLVRVTGLVLEAAGVEGRTLASSLNIAAFNLGNALGAWAGGVTIDRGLGLGTLPLVAAIITAVGLLLALWSLRLDRPVVVATQCPAE